MHKITLICSAHKENGLCNAAELLKILQATGPEVVFLEARPSDMDSYYKSGSVEARAITQYLDFKSFQQVPVDRFDMPRNQIAAIKRDFDRLFDYVEQTSPEYQRLKDEDDQSVCREGFRYLNGPAFAARRKRIHDIEEKSIIGTGEQDLIRALERWRRLIQSREVEMVRNIYKYCRDHAFETGVFLVGAAHKTAIIDEARKYADTAAALIEWNFDFDGQVP